MPTNSKSTRSRSCQQSAHGVHRALCSAAKGRQTASRPRAARRAVGVQTRAVHHQGEPDVRPGFGDIERGEGDKDLCIYGREVTPNHHKLVDEFVLLDNFYCSGVLSADGHQWTNEAYVTSYIEKAFGGFPRSYPYWGGDAMAYAPTGFIWDNVLEHKKSLRVYGEFVEATIKWKDGRKGKPNFTDCYRDFMDKKGEIDIKATAAIKTLEPYLCPTAIGFPSIVPDVHRAEQFIHELKEFEKKGELPNFMIMLLPNDHTSGTRPDTPTPAACVADNDLALGQIVEAVTTANSGRTLASSWCRTTRKPVLTTPTTM